MSHANRLFHTVSKLDYGSDGSFLTWILCILTNTFVVTSTDNHSSNGNTKFVKHERDIFKSIDNICNLNKDRRVKLYSIMIITSNKQLPALLYYFRMLNFHSRKRFEICIFQNQCILVRRYLYFLLYD